MLDPLSIFLVEDCAADVELLRMALTELQKPFELTLAEDWVSVLSVVKQFGVILPWPQIAVFDLYIPGADPDELLKLLRDYPASAQLPTIVTTSSQAPEDLELIARYGATYFLKPMEWSEYLNLAQLIGRTALPQKPSLDAGTYL